MTTALVPYEANADAGRGLAWRGCWLVTTPRARHVRWLAPWLQTVVAETWNLPLAALHVPGVRSCLGLMVAAGAVLWLALHDPVPLLGCWLAGSVPIVGKWLGPLEGE